MEQVSLRCRAKIERGWCSLRAGEKIQREVWHVLGGRKWGYKGKFEGWGGAGESEGAGEGLQEESGKSPGLEEVSGKAPVLVLGRSLPGENLKPFVGGCFVQLTILNWRQSLQPSIPSSLCAH